MQRDAEMEVYGVCVDEGMVVTIYVEMWITCYIGLEWELSLRSALRELKRCAV